MKHVLIKLLLSIGVLIVILGCFIGEMWLILVNPKLGILVGAISFSNLLVCLSIIYSSINLKPYVPKEKKKKNTIS